MPAPLTLLTLDWFGLTHQAKKSDIEIEKIAREKMIRDLAEKQVDENLDMVKMLNTLGARAAAFTVRDQQLAERESRAGIEGVSGSSNRQPNRDSSRYLPHSLHEQLVPSSGTGVFISLS